MNNSSIWSKIKRENKSLNDILSSFSLPLITLCTFAAFLATIINNQGFPFVDALSHSAIIFGTLFLGLYLSIFFSQKILSIIKVEEDNSHIIKIIAYSSIAIYLIFIITELIPEFFFIRIAYLYTPFLIHQGVKNLCNFNHDKANIIVIVLSLAILIIPYGILKIFSFINLIIA